MFYSNREMIFNINTYSSHRLSGVHIKKEDSGNEGQRYTAGHTQAEGAWAAVWSGVWGGVQLLRWALRTHRMVTRHRQFSLLPGVAPGVSGSVQRIPNHHPLSLTPRFRPRQNSD